MMGLMYTPKPKCHDADDINFLIATPRAFCCTEAAAAQPDSPDPPAHDAFTRLLHRLEPDPVTLWDEARPMVRRKGDTPVHDDSTLDKHYAKKKEHPTKYIHPVKAPSPRTRARPRRTRGHTAARKVALSRSMYAVSIPVPVPVATGTAAIARAVPNTTRRVTLTRRRPE